MDEADFIEKWKGLPLNEWRMGRLVMHACKTDDVSLMALIIAKASHDDSSVTAHEVLQKALARAAPKKAMHCLAYILEQGADVRQLNCHYAWPDLEDDPSREALELFVAYGWNVNTGAMNGQSGIPLLWRVVGDRELVQWCLDHGADVNPPDHTPPNAISPRQPLLEYAAWGGDIEIFELLRDRGAPMHYGVFPNAVMSANLKAVEGNTPFMQQMDMLRHPLDVVKCDVNEMTFGAHYESGSECVNPLCWIACHPRPNGTTTELEELICFLLDRGGDPDMTMEHRGFSKDGNILIQSARELAKKRPHHFFSKIVEDWESKRRSKASKELQLTT